MRVRVQGKTGRGYGCLSYLFAHLNLLLPRLGSSLLLCPFLPLQLALVETREVVFPCVEIEVDLLDRGHRLSLLRGGRTEHGFLGPGFGEHCGCLVECVDDGDC